MKFGQHEIAEAFDLLRSEATAVEKLAFMANQCQNPELRQILESHRGQYERAYSRLLNICQRQQWQIPAGQAGFQTPAPYTGYPMG
ncbi:MAG: spore coat protein [Chloroflexi bacterium]|nr:spore coat protein [Chloroflexota bacterium]